MVRLHLQRTAMATLFEMWLLGEDMEHLAAVGEAAWDEILRIEKMLSRFDPAAETARVNRTAAAGPVLVDYELFAVLEDCLFWNKETQGAFDIGAVAGVSFAEAVRMDLSSRTVQFLDDRMQLDFGGYGKGYALDAAARILNQFAVGSALMHGGTSSVLAVGVQEDGTPWPVGVQDPFTREPRELRQIPLTNCGLSTSATFAPGAETSDLVDPRRAGPLDQRVACVVAAPTALEAEVLSTALLAMGKPRARKYLEGRTPLDLFQVLWIEQHEESSILNEIFPLPSSAVS